MRTSTKLLFCVCGGVVLALGCTSAWFYFSESGLTDVLSIRELTEPSLAPVSVGCVPGHPVVISYESLGANARYALSAAGIREDDSGVLANLLESNGLRSSALRLSSRIVCRKERPLMRHITEIRTAIQLERKYSKRDRFTMLANSAYFGDDITGIEAASLHYFHKHSDKLDIAQSALLAGLIANPSYYSPTQHPARAFARRNHVINLMAQDGNISATDAQKACSEPLLP